MKKVLIVRLDAIGDYVLFRNFLHLVKKSKRFADAQVTLLGNSAWRSLFDALDKEVVDECIWINRKDVFKRSVDNLFPVLWALRPSFRVSRKNLQEKLKACRFDEVLSPVINRDPLLDLLLQGVAPRVCGVQNLHSCQTDRFYTSLIEIERHDSFIFKQNTFVMEKMLETPCRIIRPEIEAYRLANVAKLSHCVQSSPFVILFVGASHWAKRWPSSFYSKLARFLVERYAFDVIVAGGPEDRRRAEKVVRLTNSAKVKSTAGDWSLPELAYRIGKASLVVSNDSCAVHFAAATGVPSICVTNSITGRSTFWPYPADMEVLNKTLFREEMYASSGNILGVQIKSYLNLLSIRPEKVISTAETILDS